MRLFISKQKAWLTDTTWTLTSLEKNMYRAYTFSDGSHNGALMGVSSVTELGEAVFYVL